MRARDRVVPASPNKSRSYLGACVRHASPLTSGCVNANTPCWWLSRGHARVCARSKTNRFHLLTCAYTHATTHPPLTEHKGFAKIRSEPLDDLSYNSSRRTKDSLETRTYLPVGEEDMLLLTPGGWRSSFAEETPFFQDFPPILLPRRRTDSLSHHIKTQTTEFFFLASGDGRTWVWSEGRR